MNSSVPSHIDIMFLLTTVATVLFLYAAVKQVNPKTGRNFLVIAFAWLLISGTLAYQGFYLKLGEEPWRFFFAFPITLVVMIVLFSRRRSREFIGRMSPEILIYMSVIRIPVELVLWWYFLYGQIPELMTFEGRNFDILAGITAPIVAYFCFSRGSLSSSVVKAWNVISFLLLLNIIIHAVLSLPTPFQQFGFDRPNVGLLYFPLLWLASFVAPAVFFSHLANFVTLRKR